MEKGVYSLMPFIDFVCDNCGEKVNDLYFKISSDKKADCPKCGNSMRRLFSPTPFNFTFKAGWDAGLGEYVTSKKERARFMREKGLSFRD